MKKFITIIALTAAAAAQAQTIDGGNGAKFMAVPDSIRGYMVNDVATYDMFWVFTSKVAEPLIARQLVTGCDTGGGTSKSVTVLGTGPDLKWTLHGNGVNDQLATEVCKAALVWLKRQK